MANNITSESFDHAVDTLRFDATLELIAARCVNESARKAIRSLRPAADRAAIVTSLELIEEFRARCDEHGDVSMADVDYREAVEHLVERGEPLEALELLRVASGERISAELQRQLAIDPNAFPRLTALASGVTPFCSSFLPILAQLRPSKDISKLLSGGPTAWEARLENLILRG